MIRNRDKIKETVTSLLEAYDSHDITRRDFVEILTNFKLVAGKDTARWLREKSMSDVRSLDFYVMFSGELGQPEVDVVGRWKEIGDTFLGDE